MQKVTCFIVKAFVIACEIWAVLFLGSSLAFADADETSGPDFSIHIEIKRLTSLGLVVLVSFGLILFLIIYSLYRRRGRKIPGKQPDPRSASNL